MNEEDILLYSDYLDGNLSDDDRNSFEKRLQEEEEFAKNFEEFKGIYRVLENEFSPEREEFKKSLTLANAKYRYTEEAEKPKEKSRPFRIWQLGIAASILVVVGFVVFNQFSKPSYTDFVPLDQIDFSIRGSHLDSAQEAEKYFNSANYKEALIYLDQLLNEAPNNAELKYYKARALVELNEYEEAEILLEDLSEGQSVYVSKATYLWGLSYLKQKDYDQAKIILQQVPEGSEEYDMAKRIVSKL